MTSPSKLRTHKYNFMMYISSFRAHRALSNDGLTNRFKLGSKELYDVQPLALSRADKLVVLREQSKFGDDGV